MFRLVNDVVNSAYPIASLYGSTKLLKRSFTRTMK
jgi:hypothetical protein